MSQIRAATKKPEIRGPTKIKNQHGSEEHVTFGVQKWSSTPTRHNIYIYTYIYIYIITWLTRAFLGNDL
jgi:hypothetical protein